MYRFFQIPLSFFKTKTNKEPKFFNSSFLVFFYCFLKVLGKKVRKDKSENNTLSFQDI